MFYSRILIFSAGQDGDSKAVTWDLLSESPLVIGSIFVCMIVFALLLYVNERIIWKNKKHTEFSYVAWGFYGSLFLEPFRYIPRFISSRIVMATWILSLVVFLSFVGGNLKANIAIGEKNTIDSVTDLLNRPHITPVILSGLASSNSMRLSQDKDISALFQRSKKLGGFISWPTLLASRRLQIGLMNGEVAMVVPHVTPPAYTVITGDCQKNGKGFYYVSKKELFTMNFNIQHRKGFPQDFKEKINRKIAYFAATHQVEAPERRQRLIYSSCFWKPESQHHSSSDVLLICSIWIIGMAIATLCLIVEICFHKFCKTSDVYEENNSA